MIQFKEKPHKQGADGTNFGPFTYPILASAPKSDSIDQERAELLRHSAPTTRTTPKDGSRAVTVEDLLAGIDEDVNCSAFNGGP